VERILQECGLWAPGLKSSVAGRRINGHILWDLSIVYLRKRYKSMKHRCEGGKGCCALRILEAQTDFREGKSMLENIIIEAYFLSEILL